MDSVNEGDELTVRDMRSRLLNKLQATMRNLNLHTETNTLRVRVAEPFQTKNKRSFKESVAACLTPHKLRRQKQKLFKQEQDLIKQWAPNFMTGKRKIRTSHFKPLRDHQSTKHLLIILICTWISCLTNTMATLRLLKTSLLGMLPPRHQPRLQRLLGHKPSRLQMHLPLHPSYLVMMTLPTRT